MSAPENRSAGSSPGSTERETAGEMARMPEEPLLPVEKQLIAVSLLLGGALLAILLWISHVYFPAK